MKRDEIYQKEEPLKLVEDRITKKVSFEKRNAICVHYSYKKTNKLMTKRNLVQSNPS